MNVQTQLGRSTSRRKSSSARTDENTSLLLQRTRSGDTQAVESVAVQEPPEGRRKSNAETLEPIVPPPPVRWRIFLAAFIISLSFGVTQVPILYVFRLMTCDAYYESKAHPENVPNVTVSPWSRSDRKSNYALTIESPTKDRCALPAIESSTAISVAILGAGTTIFGLLNLFLTTGLIKRIGVKRTLAIQVFFPALRLAVQNIGVEVGSALGIIIVQSSQILTIVGGPSGYILALNTFITDVVEYEGRTAALGRLMGFQMFGSAFGFLFGGLIGDAYGIKWPFRVTLMLFMLSCLYVLVSLPYIHPTSSSDTPDERDDTHQKAGKSRFFGPLAVFAPHRYITDSGVVYREYGSFLLAIGVFLGILATGYIPTFLQMYSTDRFGFKTTENGWLIWMYSLLRGCFLTFVFPKIIQLGRHMVAEQDRAEEETTEVPKSKLAIRRTVVVDEPETEQEPLLPSDNNRARSQGTEDVQAGKHDRHIGKAGTFTFDLYYARFSLVTDGALTLLCTFVKDGWQMYLVAAVLPLAAGTGSAAKGTILQMVGSSATSAQRTDALAGISLVENIARLSTTFVFGMLFAAFARLGRTELVFICNAGVALVGFAVMMFVRFPRQDATKLEDED